MSLMHQNIVKKDDVGVPCEIDTELEDFSGYPTLEIEFYSPKSAGGTLIKTVTAADGGDGAVGRLLTYTTVTGDAVFNVAGEWQLYSKLTASGVLRRGAYPVKVMVVD